MNHCLFLFSTQNNLLCSIININRPLHSQEFYRNQFHISSSTQHHHQRTHIMPTKHRKCTKHRKHISATEKENHIGWGNRAWVFWEKWVTICCVWVCSVWFMGKMQGLWFSMDGLLGEEIGKETDPKGAFDLRKEWWFIAVTVVILSCDSNNGERK